MDILANSTEGQMTVWPAVSSAACGADLMFLLRKPMVEFAFLVTVSMHHENKPIQIYWKFYHQEMKKNSDKNSDIFHISA